MLFLSHILQQLEPYLIFASKKQPYSTCPSRIEFIENQKAFTSDRTWIGSGEQAVNQLEGTSIEPGAVIFICDSKAGNTSQDRQKNFSWIYVSCPASTLFNILNASLCQIQQWTETFCAASDQSLQKTLSCAADLSATSLILINPDNRMILSSRLDESTYLKEKLDDSGSIAGYFLEDIFSGEKSRNLPVKYSVPDSQVAVYGQKIFHGETHISTLLLEDSRSRTDMDFPGLCFSLVQGLYRHIIPTNILRLGTNTMKFQEIWHEIMTQKLTQSFDVLKALDGLPYPTEIFVRVIVVTFQNMDTEQTPFSFVLAQLRDVLPDCNMTVYENEIIILRTYCERCFEPNLEKNRLLAILERHNCYVGISNGTRDYGTLRSLYLLAKNTILLAKKLSHKQGERIFFHEEFWIYNAIDMCAHKFVELHHHDDIIYLIHPAIIHITRYDKQHNTNLRDTLFYYLLNDRNLVKTATVTFAHRNTVLNKVNKIDKIINLDLEDGSLRQRLIFSCEMIRYYEKYMNKQLKV